MESRRTPTEGPHLVVDTGRARFSLPMAVVVAAISTLVGGGLAVLGYAVTYGRQGAIVERMETAQHAIEQRLDRLATTGDLERMEGKVAASVVDQLVNGWRVVCPSYVARGTEPVRCWWAMATRPDGSPAFQPAGRR